MMNEKQKEGENGNEGPAEDCVKLFNGQGTVKLDDVLQGVFS